SLTEHLHRDGPIDEQMGRAIDGAHAAAAEPFLETVLAIKDLANEPIDWNFSNRRVRLQRHEIKLAYMHVVRILPAAFWTLEHKVAVGERLSLSPKEARKRNAHSSRWRLVCAFFLADSRL